jgi:hypothetical protein
VEAARMLRQAVIDERDPVADVTGN